MSYCCVTNCRSQQLRDKLRFFSIPSELHFKHKPEINALSAKRRQKWFESINRAYFSEPQIRYARVCSKHFLSGEPAKLSDVENIDWVPTLSMGHDGNTAEKLHESVDRRSKVENSAEVDMFQPMENPNQSGTEMNYQPQSRRPSCKTRGVIKRCECTEKHTVAVDVDSDEEPTRCTEGNTKRTASETDTNSENEQELSVLMSSRSRGFKGRKRGIGDWTGPKRYIGDFQLEDMDDPVLAQQYWHISRRRMNDYQMKIRKLTQYSRRLNNRIAYQKALLRMAKDEDENHLSDVLPEATESARKKTIWVIKCGV